MVERQIKTTIEDYLFEKTARISRTFSRAYPNYEFQVLTPANVEDFLLE